tara:strand:- start:334 stop:660 length:327 start_codon:yes stop_codon:yes gene_type:complete
MNREKELIMTNVTFITAENASVVLYAGDEVVAIADNAQDLAEAIYEGGLNFDDAFNSSTMDFASEEGFETDSGARDLLESALVIMEFFEEDDGQPDEAQEWESFDPDC